MMLAEVYLLQELKQRKMSPEQKQTQQEQLAANEARARNLLLSLQLQVSEIRNEK